MIMGMIVLMTLWYATAIMEKIFLLLKRVNTKYLVCYESKSHSTLKAWPVRLFGEDFS